MAGWIQLRLRPCSKTQFYITEEQELVAQARAKVIGELISKYDRDTNSILNAKETLSLFGMEARVYERFMDPWLHVPWQYWDTNQDISLDAKELESPIFGPLPDAKTAKEFDQKLREREASALKNP